MGPCHSEPWAAICGLAAVPAAAAGGARGPAAAAESCSAQCLGRTRARPPSPPAHGRGLAAPVRAPGSGSAAAAPPARTLIIFDWDDTLLCSSALNEGECTPEALRELARAVEAVLHTAMGLGDTVIVTNARESWVEESVRRFMPQLARTLGGLEVVSARACHERSFPGEPSVWKAQAFKEVLARRCREGSGAAPEGVNLVVLGDSRAEIEAAHGAGRGLGGSAVVKTVKFKEGPSVEELVCQLSRVAPALEALVLAGRSFDLVPVSGSRGHRWARARSPLDELGATPLPQRLRAARGAWSARRGGRCRLPRAFLCGRGGAKAHVDSHVDDSLSELLG